MDKEDEFYFWDEMWNEKDNNIKKNKNEKSVGYPKK